MFSACSQIGYNCLRLDIANDLICLHAFLPKTIIDLFYSLDQSLPVKSYAKIALDQSIQRLYFESVLADYEQA